MLEEESRSLPGVSLLTATILVGMVGVLVGFLIGLAYRAEGASLLLLSTLVAYIVVIVAYPRLLAARLLLALFMMCSHLGAILAYYSNPIVLPFVVIERGARGSSINLDFTQLILAYEIANAYLSSRLRDVMVQQVEVLEPDRRPQERLVETL
ncbi:MAG: hypothetical protein QXS85_01010 [Acidilobaceae archaeon]